jgi:hypothetical protein
VRHVPGQWVTCGLSNTGSAENAVWMFSVNRETATNETDVKVFMSASTRLRNLRVSQTTFQDTSAVFDTSGKIRSIPDAVSVFITCILDP